MATNPSPVVVSWQLFESNLVHQGTHHTYSLTHTQTTGSTLDSDAMQRSTSPFTKSLPQPISGPDRMSSDTFQKAPGAEVKSKSLEDEGQVRPWS